jgi:hypothetical protein
MPSCLRYEATPRGWGNACVGDPGAFQPCQRPRASDRDGGRAAMKVKAALVVNAARKGAQALARQSRACHLTRSAAAPRQGQLIFPNRPRPVFAFDLSDAGRGGLGVNLTLALGGSPRGRRPLAWDRRRSQRTRATRRQVRTAPDRAGIRSNTDLLIQTEKVHANGSSPPEARATALSQLCIRGQPTPFAMFLLCRHNSDSCSRRK